jgi:hypothetical protein
MSDRNKAGRTARNGGDKSGSAKTDWPTVRRMRQLYATGLVRIVDLSRMFNLAENQVGEIIHNQSWVETS